MPVIELSFVENKKEVDFAYIADALTSLTADILYKDPKATLVKINEVKSETTFAGSEEQKHYFDLNIRITKDTNSKEEKALWISAVNHFMNKYLIIDKDQTLNYITVQEISADSWGYGGLTQFSRNGKRD